MQKRTDFFDNSLLSIVPDIPLVIRNKPHNNQLCADLSRLISAYPVVSHFLRFAWQTTTIGFFYKIKYPCETFWSLQGYFFIFLHIEKDGQNPSFEKAYSAQNLLEFDLSASLFELSLDFLSFSLRSAFLDSLRSSFNELLSFLKTKTANVLNCLDNSHLSITE